MNDYKYIKPNLADPLLEKKIVKTLTPPNEDYWGPTRTGLNKFYHKFIKPNWGLVVVLILLACFLIYRYRYIKDIRDEQKIQMIYNKINTNNIPYLYSYPIIPKKELNLIDDKIAKNINYDITNKNDKKNIINKIK